MKVTIVYDKTGGGPAFEKIVGLFSDHDPAIAYCDHKDPKEVRLAADDYTIDELVEPEDRREIWAGN